MRVLYRVANEETDSLSMSFLYQHKSTYVFFRYPCLLPFSLTFSLRSSLLLLLLLLLLWPRVYSVGYISDLSYIKRARNDGDLSSPSAIAIERKQEREEVEEERLLVAIQVYSTVQASMADVDLNLLPPSKEEKPRKSLKKERREGQQKERRLSSTNTPSPSSSLSSLMPEGPFSSSSSPRGILHPLSSQRESSEEINAMQSRALSSPREDEDEDEEEEEEISSDDEEDEEEEELSILEGYWDERVWILQQEQGVLDEEKDPRKNLSMFTKETKDHLKRRLQQEGKDSHQQGEMKEKEEDGEKNKSEEEERKEVEERRQGLKTKQGISSSSLWNWLFGGGESAGSSSSSSIEKDERNQKKREGEEERESPEPFSPYGSGREREGRKDRKKSKKKKKDKLEALLVAMQDTPDTPTRHPDEVCSISQAAAR